MKKILFVSMLFALPFAASADVWQDLATYTYGDASNAADAADKLIQETPVAEHGALEDKLIAVIASKDATQAGKEFACRLLQQIGTAKAIPALSALLTDEALSHYARLPLEMMKLSQADAALRDALAQAPDSVKTGLAGSLGERGDAKAVPALTNLAGSTDVAVAMSCLQALGEIATPDAVKYLKSVRFEGLTKVAHMEALVAAASASSKSDAVALYDKLLAEGRQAHRVAALKGLISADTDRAGKLILEAVRSDDATVRKGALGLAADAEGPGLTALLMKALPDLGAVQQADVITSVGRTGEKSVTRGLSGYLKSEDEGVRKATAAALGRLGDGATAKMLLGMTGTEGVISVVATMSGSDVDEALLDALSDSALRSSAVQALVARGTKGAAPRLLQLAGDGDATVRGEAWKGLASLGSENDMPGMMKAAMAITDDKEMGKALGTVKRIAAQAKDPKTCFDAIASYYDGAPTSVKGRLLDVAAVVGNERALELQRKALKSGEAELYGKAVRALSNWSNASAAKDLVGIAKTAQDNSEKIIALRGFIRLAGLAGSSLGGEERTAMFKQADALAERADEKRLIISGLRNAGTPEAMQMLVTYMGNAELKTDAELSASDLVWNLRATKSDAVRELAVKLSESENASVSQKARDTLAEFDKSSTYVKAWLVSGPYRVAGKDGNAIFNIEFAPEKSDGAATWSALQKGIGEDVINLEAEVGGGDNYCAYVKTTVHSPVKQAVRLEMGSDDGVKAWLNGKLVHANMQSRGHKPGQDKVSVNLNKGENLLMLKVVDLSSHYSFSCRIMNDQGAVKGLKYVP